jgi:hypothetical protein
MPSITQDTVVATSSNGMYVYVMSQNGGSSGILRSSDYGKTFSYTYNEIAYNTGAPNMQDDDNPALSPCQYYRFSLLMSHS